MLFNGLRRLEYRGYDSAGISIDSDEDGERVLHGLAVPALPPLVFREEGKIDKLVTSVYQGMVALCFFLGSWNGCFGVTLGGVEDEKMFM